MWLVKTMKTTTDMIKIYLSLKPLLQRYCPPLIAKVEDGKRFDLWSIKDIVIEGRKRKEVFFASIIIQKAYVGFYFMPVYTDPEMKDLFPSALLSLLKGKSCFHIKQLDYELFNQIRIALDDGFALYTSRGWV